MKLHLIILTILFVSCKDTSQKIDKPKGWTEEQKRQYFSDSIAYRYGFGQIAEDSTKTFTYFFQTHYPEIKTLYSFDAFPYAFEEEYVDTSKIDSSKHWFRVTVHPCFRLPYCFIVEKRGRKSFLTTKITDGDGGYHTGVLLMTMKLSFADTLYDNIVKHLNSLDFWKVGMDTTCQGGLDGETWVFEAIDNGKYNAVERWVPQDCGNRTTRDLAKLGLNLASLSKLDEILKTLGHPKRGM